MLNKLTALLAAYFKIGGNCYTFSLERDKAAFEIGAMTTDDFREFSQEDAEEIAAYLIDKGVIFTEWIPVEDGLPENETEFEEYLVTVSTSHFPTSSFDPCDAPYLEEKTTVAKYDSAQKLWHFENGYVLNALIMPEDSPLNGDCVTHWKPMPLAAGKDGA